MKAVIFERYGPPEVLQLKEVVKPSPRSEEILVKVLATTVTAGDRRMRQADPLAARLYNGLFRPTRVKILGFEFAGEVEAIGAQVDRFREGDQVFGRSGFEFGAYAEYKCMPQAGLVAKKPDNLSFEEAAAVPLNGLAALNLLRKGDIQADQEVLIYGASGSVGLFAVQIANLYGAKVTGVSSGRHLAEVEELGAEAVLDYTKEDFRERPKRYDLIFDAAGKLIHGFSKAEFKRALKPEGKFVDVEMSRKDRAEDLDTLRQLIEGGDLRPVLDRSFPLEQAAKAHEYVESSKRMGSVILTLGQN